MDKTEILPAGEDVDGVKEIRHLIKEYLGTGEGTPKVREFLSQAHEDEELLLRFFRGRKNRPKHAWETIKTYAEYHYDKYPEIFSAPFPKEIIPLLESHMMGLLKARDSKGRRIGYLVGNQWDPDKVSMEMITIACTYFVERLLHDEDCMNNGVVFIQECTGMGMRHAKQYSFKQVLRFINVFWYAYPLKLRGMCYLNVPTFTTFVYALIKPFLPRKLRDRFVVTSSGKKFEELHKMISPDVLPKCLGGKLENADACENEILTFNL